MLDKIEIKSRIESLSRNAIGAEGSTLATDRAEALDHYHGRPYGNEMVGRSSVVSKDLAEVVDWAVPELVDIFLASGNIAEFMPIGEDDEELAQQESDYVNHVIMQENNGFLVLHDWIKDGLLLKNGYAKTWWEEKDRVEVQRYEGLTYDEVAMLLQEYGDAAEITKQEVVEVMTPEGMPMEIYEIELRITHIEGRQRVEAVPAEEVRVSKNCRGDINETDYIEHDTEKSRSDLIEMGLDAAWVNDLPANTSDENTQEAFARDTIDGESGDEEDGADESQEMVRFREIHARIDVDEDGVGELRKIIIVGNEIPDGDEWNQEVEQINLSFLTPKRMPHRHIGQSLDDEVNDLQEIKTTLQRSFLDNVYGLVHQEWLVNERANIDDFLVSRPLGVKRVKGNEPVTGVAEPVIKPNILDKVLPAIDYFDSLRSQRTGVKPEMTGLDPDALQNTTKGAYLQNLKQANSKLQFIARMIAEIGVSDLIRKVHSDLIRHSDKEKVVKLRGKYVQINPTEWKSRTDLKINVGIGTGSREEQRENAMMIAQAQQQLAPIGLVGAKQAYNTFMDLAESLGETNPSKYVLDPDSDEFKEYQEKQQQGGQSNPLAEAEMVKGRAAMEIEQIRQAAKMQGDAQKQQFDGQIKMLEESQKMAIEQMKAESRENTEILKAELQAFLAGADVDVGEPGLGAEL